MRVHEAVRAAFPWGAQHPGQPLQEQRVERWVNGGGDVVPADLPQEPDQPLGLDLQEDALPRGGGGGDASEVWTLAHEAASRGGL